jgi:hypothetical protein
VWFSKHFIETRLQQCKFQGGEFARNKLDDFGGGRRREDEGVDAVDDAVCAELEMWLVDC